MTQGTQLYTNKQQASILRLELKAGVKSKNTVKTSLSLWELIGRYEVSNKAAGKSVRTTRWYDELLRALAGYLEANYHACDLSFLNVDTVRDYILYLRQKPKFSGHPYAPAQTETLSPRTVQCHVRASKAFASWLYAEGYTSENRLKNLKLPKAPATVMEPLSPEEIDKVVSSINKQSPTSARNHAIIVTLLDSGMRAAEAASITLGNLNLSQG